MPRRLLAAGLTGLVCASFTPIAGAIFIDQSQPNAAVPLADLSGTVQSFKPAYDLLYGVDAFSAATNKSISGAEAVTVKLYSGLPSAGGTLLATATDDSVTAGDEISADFATPVSVTPETTYYLAFTDSGGFGLSGSTSNPYSRGQLYISNGGVSFSQYDLAFQTLAPEPASFAAMGILSLIALKRTRRPKM